MGKLTSFRDDAYPRTLAADPLASADFSLDTARFMAWSAQLAYEVAVPEILHGLTERWGWRNVQPIRSRLGIGAATRDAYGYVAEIGAACVVAFTGTEPDQVSDWRIDFDFLRQGNYASPGVAKALDIVWDGLAKHIAATTGPVFIAGHSLGGAFAVVAAIRLAAAKGFDMQRLAGVYTFGMPRIGNTAFTTGYNAMLGGELGNRTYRLVYGDDLVARVPPAGTGELEFRHVGRKLSCDHAASFAGIPAPPEVEGTDGNLAATLGMLKDVSANWDRIGGQIASSLAPLLPEFLRDLLPGGQHAPPPPFPARDDAAARGAALLPPSLRDHLLDRYLRALGVRFPGD